MSYNIFNKNASFQGTTKGESGSLEYMIDTHTTQTANGSKTFTNLTASNGMDFGSGLISGSGKISASFFYGDGAGLSGVAIAAGANREVQFNDGGTALGASSNFTFTAANQLQVTGQISASLGVSGSTFHGDGSNLTAVTASFVTASNVVGILGASQVNIGQGLENAAGAIQVKLQSNSGIEKSVTGIALNVFGLGAGIYNDSSTIALGVSTGDTKKITLSALENSLQIGGGNITGSNSILNAVLPTTINQPIISGSTAISGAFFYGDGAGLTNVSSTPAPAGSNTQIQFNDDAALAGDADLTFLTGSNTLATSNLSASVNISGSSLYLQDEIYVGGQAFLDIETNVAANNASFTEITASSTISSSADVYGAAFIGDGRQLSGAPVDTAVANAVVTVVNVTDKTITSNANFKYDGSDVTVTSGDVKATNLSASANVQVGGHITGSGNIVLTGSTNSIIFDMASNNGPSITSAGENVLTIDGDNTLKLRGDNYVTIQKDNTDKFNFNLNDDKMVTAMLLSSSAAVSASIFDSLTGYKIGNQAIVDSNANLTVGLIGSQNISIVYDSDESANALDFGAGAISGSGNISGSSLYFADSLNLGSTTLIDANANANLGQLTCYVDSKVSSSLPSNNNSATFYVDEGADKFFVYVKYSDGSTKSGSINLT